MQQQAGIADLRDHVLAIVRQVLHRGGEAELDDVQPGPLTGGDIVGGVELGGRSARQLVAVGRDSIGVDLRRGRAGFGQLQEQLAAKIPGQVDFAMSRIAVRGTEGIGRLRLGQAGEHGGRAADRRAARRTS